MRQIQAGNAVLEPVLARFNGKLMVSIRQCYGLSHRLVIRDGQHLHTGRVLLIEGVVQREAEVTNVIAQRIAPLAMR